MSTTVPEIPSPPIRSSTPHARCPVSKENLLDDKKAQLGLTDDCPMCLDLGLMVRVCFHHSLPQGKCYYPK